MASICLGFARCPTSHSLWNNNHWAPSRTYRVLCYVEVVVFPRVMSYLVLLYETARDENLYSR